jgi:choline dehydrogenase-like flavoprotein
MIQQALQSGNCELLTEVMVEKLITNEYGKVTGVAYQDANQQRVEAHAEIIVISCGAVETARLLLNSKTAQEPDGIGNKSDQVGRHLQGHYYPGAVGLFPDVMWDGVGPGAAIATCEFNHDNDGIIGGGMLCDEYIVLPMTFWKRDYPPDVPRWGHAAKQFMRDNYRRITDIKGPVQEIPHPDGRVTVNPNVHDKYGIPVAHLSGTTHPETVRTAQFMHERAKEWLVASGAIQVWGNKPSLYLSGGQHQAGTCRMGDDPMASVTDKWSRVHGHENLFIADGSVHVTNGGFNPVLTIMALAWRTAEHILGEW